ncbi:MAG: hypothetical protein ACYS1A_14425 [Planctomycetota bacterium]
MVVVGGEPLGWWGDVGSWGWLIGAGGGGRGRRIFTRRWRVVGSVVVGAGLTGLVR